MRQAGFLVIATLLASCAKTEECEKLERLKQVSAQVLAAAKGRAELAERTGQHLERVKAAVKKTLDEHGLDLDEGKIVEALEARLESVKGARFERTVRATEARPGAMNPRGASETVFRFTFPASGLEEAWSKAQILMASPPLTRLFTLVAPRTKKELWRLDLGRADIQKLPMDVAPRPIPPRPSADDIPSSFGFCGAGKLREEIAAMEVEIAKFEKDAIQTTVNLPLTASWTGLSRRADLVVLTEREGRSIADAVIRAVLDSGQQLIALGAEPEAVLVELVEQKGTAAAMQAKLPKDLLEREQQLPPAREGVVRIAIGNRISAAHRRPDKIGPGGPGGPGHGPGGFGPGPGGPRPGRPVPGPGPRPAPGPGGGR